MSTATCEMPVPAKAETHPTSQELWQRYHRYGDAPSENALVQQYLPLVRSTLGRLAMTLPEHVDHDDLHSAGLIGLLQALRNYDPSCGTSFETYARVRVRGAMLDELRRMDWVPRTVHEKARRIQEVISRLEQQYGRSPTEKEMARAMKISVDEYNELLDEIRPAAFVCLDAVSNCEGSEGANLYEVVAGPDSDGPVEEVSRRELKKVILDRLKQLPEMQRKVLALYYGEDLHLREIAEAFGLTESRICQIHSQAILSIRSYLQRFESGIAGQVASSKKS
jgi:RNA polymerase sigma factor for flagellar operon FliA